ncbi:hypothetical protein QYF36_010310 [Acer negundo]|nr:hypothetical protein QYF36_010310 [Acer negundo]
MENQDFTRLNSKPLNGEEVDLQGTDHCHSPTCQSQNQDCSLESPRPNKGKEIVEELKLGMKFNSEESAYRAYVKFGGENSFNVRKHHRKKNKMGLITRVSYCCSKQGYRRNNNEIEDPSYSAPISRVGCDAHMACLLQKNGNFKIVSFNPNDNPKESVGKRYGHLYRNFREISSFATEHEELTAYAYEFSVELFKSVEQMKKNLCINSTFVNQSSQGQALFDENCGYEQIAMKTLQNSEITKPRGIETKPTVGRPRNRLKGALERRKSQIKATKTKTTKQLSMKVDILSHHEYNMLKIFV